MSKPPRKRRLPEPVALAIAIVERVTGETLVERPKVAEKGYKEGKNCKKTVRNSRVPNKV